MTSLLPEVGMARWAHWAREPRDDADTPAKGSMQGGPRIAQLSTLGSLSELFTANHPHGAEQHQLFKNRRQLAACTKHRHGIPVRRALRGLLAEANNALDEAQDFSEEETAVLIAALTEKQLRLLLELELELAASAYWSCGHWQEQREHPLQAWVEAGPFTWFCDPQEKTTLDDKIDALQRMLVHHTTAAGVLQQHLTRKIVNTDPSYLRHWSQEALALIDDVLHDRVAPTENFDPREATHPGHSTTLEQCIYRARHLHELVADRYQDFSERMNGLRPPPFLRRKWLWIVVASPFLLYSVRWAVTNRKNIPKWVRLAIDSSREFYREHIIDPAHDIVKELLLNEHQSITDVAGLLDAKQSLTRMLDDFLKDTAPNMTEAERKAVASRMDMSAVSARYEKSLPQAVRHVFTGEIVRILLINVQYLKKELLVAMSALDELMDANAINFRLFAIFPALLVLYGAYQGGRQLSNRLRNKKSRQETAAVLRSTLLSMERMLNLRNVNATEEDVKLHRLDERVLPLPHGPHLIDVDHLARDRSTTIGTAATQGTHSLNPVVFLKAPDLGLLLLLLAQFSQIMIRNKRIFSSHELRDLQEDLRELAGDSGPVAITQQLAIISRMFRSYRFLNSNVTFGFFSL